MTRPSNRRPDELRPVSFERGFTHHAEGSVLVAFGNTRVLCTASVEDRVPPFLRGSIPYSAVTQPLPLLRRKWGTRSSTEAVHSTRVSPNPIRTDPSACLV